MTITCSFLKSEYPCERTHSATMNVYLHNDLRLDVNNNIQLKLPISFMMYSGCVVLNTVDDRLVPVKEIYMNNSDNDGLVVTLYNRSYSIYNGNKGDKIIILRYIE